MFWAFVILATVYLEAYGALFTRPGAGAIPFIGHWPVLGFLQDFIAVMALVGIVTFAVIRLRNRPSSSAAGRGSSARTSAARGSRCS